MIKSRILVVDDEPNLSDLVRFFLEKTQRYDVRVVNRSAQALAAAREFQPHLILLDVDMPGKDGGDVAKEINADRVLCGTPVLFLTSLVSRADTKDGVAIRGGMRFLPKPVDATALVQTVDALLAAECVAA
jgi:DNA-binding response OmpR family regulator